MVIVRSSHEVILSTCILSFCLYTFSRLKARVKCCHQGLRKLNKVRWMLWLCPLYEILGSLNYSLRIWIYIERAIFQQHCDSSDYSGTRIYMIKGAINLNFTIVTCVNIFLSFQKLPLDVSFVSSTE